VKKFGADALRMYLMFLAPFEQGGDFRDKGILGVTRFLERTWKCAGNIEEKGSETTIRAAHRAIKKITKNIESIHYNTAVSALMICLNSFEVAGRVGKEEFGLFLRLLAPFAPHITDTLWRDILGEKNSIHVAEWPKFDPALTEESRATLVIQVNGKVRDTVEVEKGLSEAEATEIAQAREKIKTLLNGQAIKKTVYVEAKIINFIV
jgi:leucyl-tRNA synthetase